MSSPSTISDSYHWTGRVGQIPSLVDSLFGLTDIHFDLYYVSASCALKIDLVSSRATAQPGELFWLVNSETICSGDFADYQEARAKAAGNGNS